ncbi:MAG: helix-turn-helix domain-containing protein [Pseudomonadota bacterium]
MYDVPQLSAGAAVNGWVVFDLAIRFAIAAITLLLIGHLLNLRRLAKTWTLISALAVSAWHILDRSSVSSLILGPLEGLSYWPFMLSPILIVWACLDFFTDDFRPGRRHIAGASAYVGVMSAVHLFGLSMAFAHAAEFLIYGYLLRTAFCADVDDLVESRRGFRRFFVMEVALGCMIITVLVVYCQFNEQPVWFDAAISSIVLAIIATLTFWMLNVREDLWPHKQAVASAKKVVAKNGLSVAENALVVRLENAMEEGVWRQEGLTIRTLAESLDAPEHRLRRVINQGLGYRNFSAFINERRVAAAAEAFANPDRADVPVLTIAYESGFASLGPFNRAFRQFMGKSPTDFRKQSLEAAFGPAE